MAGHGKRQVLWENSTAVVTHADQPRAATLDHDVDVGGAGVEAILHELLHHGRRALDDLACGDLVYELGGKDVDSGHAPIIPRVAFVGLNPVPVTGFGYYGAGEA